MNLQTHRCLNCGENVVPERSYSLFIAILLYLTFGIFGLLELSIGVMFHQPFQGLALFLLFQAPAYLYQLHGLIKGNRCPICKMPIKIAHSMSVEKKPQSACIKCGAFLYGEHFCPNCGNENRLYQINAEKK